LAPLQSSFSSSPQPAEEIDVEGGDVYENRGPIFLQGAPGALSNIIQIVIHEFLSRLVIKGGFKQLRILSRE
jgi:hypothetical protein